MPNGKQTIILTAEVPAGLYLDFVEKVVKPKGQTVKGNIILYLKTAVGEAQTEQAETRTPA